VGVGTVTADVRVLLVSGSLRANSTNAALLRAAAELVPPGVTATTFDGLGMLPHFNPDDDRDPLDPAVARLRGAVGAADAVVISTPEYAGALPGSFKNLLDWLVGGVEVSRKPVAWLNASAGGGAAGAHASLRTVLGYVDADIVEAACAHVPVPRSAVGPDGRIGDPAIRAPVTEALQALVGHVIATRAGGSRA
jgi:chromate reductase